MLFAGTAAPAQAQVYELTAGASSLYDARGGSVQLYGASYQARFAAGYVDHAIFGVHFKGFVRGVVLGVGDDSIPFPLPTDLFNSTYLVTRGVSIERVRKQSRALFLAGATSQRFALPFFSGARAETPAGLVFYERQLRPTIRVLSQNMISARQTSIQSLQWTPSVNTTVGAGGGIGNNGHYAAASLSMDRSWTTLRAGYTFAGQQFGRIPVPGTSGAESEKENLLLRLQRARRAQVTFTRQNLLTQVTARSTAAGTLRARVDGVSGSISAAGSLQFHSSYFDSVSTRGGAPAWHGRGFTAGATGHLSTYLGLQVDVFENHAGPQVTRFAVGSLRERFGSKLTLSQTVTRAAAGTTVSYGGEIRGNLISVGVGSQMVFVPFAAPGRGGFQQALQFSVMLRLPHDASLNVSTVVDALGQTKYTAYGSAYAYGSVPDPAAHPHAAAPNVRFERFVVTGRVIDAEGDGVAGAAVQIGSDTVFTDSEGTFSSAQRRQAACLVAVLIDQFMFDGAYEVVRAPATAVADVADKATPLTIVVRRVR
jgi:hypothetical protein